MIIIKNAEVYAPDFLGKKDLVIQGEKVVLIAEKVDEKSLEAFEPQTIDARGQKLVPGFIDAHVHIAGAGGEGGPVTRTPEMPLSRMVEAGVTSVVGCLGADGFTRSLENLLMKVKALRTEGVSAWMYTGAYQIPTPTLTGNVATDLALIDEVIGIGEIALSDHRSSFPTTDEFIRLVSQARVGAMLGKKSGIANIHLGDARNPFRPLYEAVEKSELKLSQFLPTHCNRNHYIFEDAKTYGQKSYIDLTASSYPFFPDEEIKPSKAIAELLKSGVPIEYITLTSDAMGSLPSFDERGNLLKLEIGLPYSIFSEMRDAVRHENILLETALKTITSNIADILKLPHKGRIFQQADADLVLLDKDMEIHTVIARGKVFMLSKEIIRKGSFD